MPYTLSSEKLRDFVDNKMEKKKNLLKQLITFGMIGVSNTAISAIGMLVLYNSMGFGYWGSSAFMYVLGSIWSFFMNRRFTFHSTENIGKQGIRFFANVVTCYVVAYWLAPYLIELVLQFFVRSFAKEVKEQIAMMLGMILFTVMNFIGQKIIVFSRKE